MDAVFAILKVNDPRGILVPAVAIVFLFLCALVRLAYLRVKYSTSSKEMAKYYKHHIPTEKVKGEPVDAHEATRHFANFCEMPPFFLVGCLICFLLQQQQRSSDVVAVGAAWLYVAARWVHQLTSLSLVVPHIVGLRFAAFAISNVAFTLLWVRVAMAVLA